MKWPHSELHTRASVAYVRISLHRLRVDLVLDTLHLSMQEDAIIVQSRLVEVMVAASTRLWLEEV